MVSRTFVAQDNENFVVTSSSSGGLVGNGVINNSSTPNGTVFQYNSGSGEQITLNDTGGSSNTFEDDQASNHVITDGAGLVANGQTVEAESLIFVRQLDEFGNQIGPTITVTVFSQGGSIGDVWGFASDVPLVDGASYVKTSGSNAGSSSYSDFVTCFGPGTLIDTPDGPRAVETLNHGDRITTQDGPPLPIRWIVRRSVEGHGAFAPVVFEPGAIGNTRRLVLSQEHRVFLSSARAQLLFGTDGVLIAAKHLTDLPGVAIVPQPRITYTHFMFDTHQIVCSDGVWTESFFLSNTAVRGLDAAARSELLSIYPELSRAQQDFGALAAMAVSGREAAVLCAGLQAANRFTAQVA